MFVSDQCPDFLPFSYLLSTTGLRLLATCRTTGTDNRESLARDQGRISVIHRQALMATEAAFVRLVLPSAFGRGTHLRLVDLGG
jgi:hypothetical protein